MPADFDLAIVGSGFAGSILAMIARRLGRSVILVERGAHPRFAIGESSTPLANLLLEELARRYDLPALASLSKWGTWQREHPAIGCGLKRGFTFYQHTDGQPWCDEPPRSRQLLVAASPHDAIADTHWYRPDFDQFLAQQAAAMGAELVERVELDRADFDAGGATLSGRREGRPFAARARFVFDASGPRGFLHRALALPELGFEAMPPTQGLYAHFEGVRRWEELFSLREPTCSLTRPAGTLSLAGGALVSKPARLGSQSGAGSESGAPVHAEGEPDSVTPPYPPDDAALHHVFDGGWIWVLRFNNGITSAGAALRDGLADELCAVEGAAAWTRLLDRLPSVREQFADARAVTPFVHALRLSFLSGRVADERWALLPSAAGFVDPLLSTGFPLTLLGIERLARWLEQSWGAAGAGPALFDYSLRTTEELALTSRLIGALYGAMDDFELFEALALLYFAAASYTETARRLGRPELAGGAFLCGEHPVFGPRLRWCVSAALRRDAPRALLLERVRQAIEPVDVAGLGRADRAHWHPVDAAGLFAAREKLGASRADIERLLERCGFAAPAVQPA
jgi:FADH2 O2-dependent halogenase